MFQNYIFDMTTCTRVIERTSGPEAADYQGYPRRHAAMNDAFRIILVFDYTW